MAAPCPIWPDSRPTWRARVAKRCVELMGPPWVSTYTMLKSLNVKIVEKSTTIASTGFSSGSVTSQKRATGPAPSASAASYSSRGMETSPARIVMAKKGRPRQTLTTTTAVIA